ncbi:hypothetical protein WMY93_029803 [Mugilogobius chulae]|uniref:Reverse transcriptase domain-containing protein n=1 Tax=Mugilogobius chulae TaxID=88201 RepID=A0AAW0MQ19_9GOBI
MAKSSPGPDGIKRPHLLLHDKRGIKLARLLVGLWDPRSMPPPHPRQRGFAKGPGCAENILIINRLHSAEKSRARSLGAAFIDLSKAFDSVSHQLIIEVLERKGVDQLLINVIRSAYSEAYTMGEEVQLNEHGEVIQYLGILVDPWKGVIAGNPMDQLEDLISKVGAAQLKPSQKVTLFKQHRDGGLNIPRLSQQIARIQLKRCVSLLFSEDEVTSGMAKGLKLESMIRNLWKHLTGTLPEGPLEELDFSSVNSQKAKADEFKRWAHLQWQGRRTTCFQDDKISNCWLSGPDSDRLSESEFILALRGLRVSRSHNQCLSHPQEQQDGVTQRHLQDPAPDGPISWLDVPFGARTGESRWRDKEILVNIEFHKRKKYFSLISAVKELSPSIPKTVRVWGFLLGARGKWHPPKSNLLRALGLSDSRILSLAKTFSLKALFGTIAMCKAFNRITSGKTSLDPGGGTGESCSGGVVARTHQ